jgi:small-conductance mechanosensitive channel
MIAAISLISYAWQDIRVTVITVATLAGAILAGLLCQFLVFGLAHRIIHDEPGSLPRMLLQKTRTPSRYIFPLLALVIAVPFMPLPQRFGGYFERTLNIAFIAVVGWTFIVFIQVVANLLTFRYSIDVEDNLQARRIRTQTLVMQRVAVVLVIAITLAVILMTFPSARQIGTSIFASAGIAGLIVGMAARSTFAGIIAGLQVALTQPIRIDDAVIVEGEWGWIEEIETTYVVIRLWDLRRLIVPLTYFIEKPFQNWTRSTAEIIGTVFLYVDYSLPVEPVREEFLRILKETRLWNGRTAAFQVTDFTEHAMQLRAIMSANNSSAAFDLRCYIRENLISFLQKHYPSSLPTARTQLTVREAETFLAPK